MFFQKIISLIFLSLTSFSAEAIRLLKKETLKKVLLPWVYRQYPDIQENLEKLNAKERKALAVQIAKVIAQSSAYRNASKKDKKSAETRHIQMIEELLQKDQEQIRQKKKNLTQDVTGTIESCDKKPTSAVPEKEEQSTVVSSTKALLEKSECDPRKVWMEKRRTKINDAIAQILENPTPENLKRAQSIIDQSIHEEMRLRSSLSLAFPETILLPNEDFLQLWQELREKEPQIENITSFWNLLKILVQLNEDVESDPRVKEAALKKHWELSLPQKIHEECASILKIYQNFRKKYGNMSEIWNSMLTDAALDLLKGRSNKCLIPSERKKLLAQLYRLEKFPQWSEDLFQEFFSFSSSAVSDSEQENASDILQNSSKDSLAAMSQVYQSLLNLKQKVNQSDLSENAALESLIFDYPTKVSILKSMLS